MHTCGTCGTTMVETTGGCATCASGAPSTFPTFAPPTSTSSSPAPVSPAAPPATPWAPPVTPLVTASAASDAPAGPQVAPPASTPYTPPLTGAPRPAGQPSPVPDWGAVPSAHWNTDHADLWGPPAEVEWGPEVLHAHIAPPKPLHKRSGTGTAIGVGVALLAVATAIVLGIMFLGDLDDGAGSRDDTADFTEIIEGDWASHTTANGVFTLELPGTPERQAIDVPTELGAIETELIYSGPGSVDDAEQGVLAMNADYGTVIPGAQMAAAFDTFLASVANGALQKNGGELVGTERVESPIGPAGQFTGRYAERDLVMHGFVTFNGSRMVAIMVIVDDADQDVGKLTLARAVAGLKVN